MLVGFYNSQGDLIYAGRVGTGFADDVLNDLKERLTRLEQDDCPFAELPKGTDRKTRWVQPLLVAQVEYGSWTDEGRLRHPVFQGLREDRSATSVVRPSENDQARPPEEPARSTKAKRKSSVKRKAQEPKRELMPESKLAELAQVPITSPEKLLYADVGITKLGLAAYYVQVSDWILPHLADRPVSLVRCPEGAHAECFYQKHAAKGTPETLRRVTIPEKEAKGDYLVVDNLPALASLVQIGVLEIHPWPARTDRIDRPDRMIFDLDPDESVPWSRVIDAAFVVREFLNTLGLGSFVKTTGGKGLHVVVPIQRRHGWDEVKAFSEAVAKSLAAQSPREYTATMSKAARKGKIYIDYQRHNRGATAVAAYSTRARAGAPVAVPLFWEELSPAVGPNHFHVGNVPARLAALDEDPWAEMLHVSQALTARAKKRLRL
jgi:bifunctional non-homologous end joining protein LigD